MAVISLLLSAVLTWPSATPALLLQADTKCAMFMPQSCEPRKLLPPMATTCPASDGHRLRIHATKHPSKHRASSSENTRLNVSCEAMPLSKGRKGRSHCSLSSPHCTTLTQSSAPLVIALSATNSNSCSGYGHSRLRGSSSASNACSI
jgi:hypothetical protein